jgi:hypothetical protein
MVRVPSFLRADCTAVAVNSRQKNRALNFARGQTLSELTQRWRVMDLLGAVPCRWVALFMQTWHVWLTRCYNPVVWLKNGGVAVLYVYVINQPALRECLPYLSA